MMTHDRFVECGKLYKLHFWRWGPPRITRSIDRREAMTNTPLYTLTEAMEAKDSIVSTVEFAFFTALADITDAGGTPDCVGEGNG